MSDFGTNCICRVLEHSLSKICRVVEITPYFNASFLYEISGFGGYTSVFPMHFNIKIQEMAVTHFRKKLQMSAFGTIHLI